MRLAGPGTGILLTIAPSEAVAADLPTLLRVALDGEQVGAGRLHLPAQLPGAELAVRELRANTGLLLTCDAGGAAAELCDPPGPRFSEVIVEPADPADLLTMVAALAVEAQASGRAISVSGRGAAELPVALAAMAGGLHLRVGTADVPGDGTGPPSPRPDVALIARAAGLARIAGRPPIRGTSAAALLGVGAAPGFDAIASGAPGVAGTRSVERTVH